MGVQAISKGETDWVRSPYRRMTKGHLSGIGTAMFVAWASPAVAFPLIDPSNQDSVPTGTELASPDAQDLQHQLRLANGLLPPSGGGWTFVPSVSAQEMLTDNVLQQHAPRQWDLTTYIAPGFSVAGDLPRLQVTFSIAPTLAVYANESSLNALTQQFDGTGLLTVVPDLAYIDFRAVSGVHSLYGGIGGLGTVGASSATANSSAATIPSLAGNSLGLTKDNEVQTTGFAISPYLLRRFGDWGTGKIGYSLNVSQSDTLTGFVAPPYTSGGANSQTSVTNEEIAHFATGDFLGSLQDSVDVDLQQSSFTTGSGYSESTTGLPATGSPTTSSTRAVFTDQLSYVLNREITVFASGGHEYISYTGSVPVNDLTWNLGVTLTPNPDSLLTVSYGHQNGYNAFSANGHYNVTARTVLTVSYGSTLGTQLENLQNQLNLATANGTGSLVNGQTGGALFNNINALGVQEGVFRTDTLTFGSQTSLDRDIISATLSLTKQSQQNGSAASLTTADTFSLQWLHQIHPDLTLSAALSYSVQDQATGTTALNPGNSRSVVGSIALQQQISETLSASLRYSFFGRSSEVTAYSFTQNMLILGITKTF